MAKKLPRWFTMLSSPVRAAVEAHVKDCGYTSTTAGEVVGLEHDFDGWIADMLTTAHRSPQGYILRFKKKGEIVPEPPTEEAPMLFPPGGGLDS